MLSDGLFHKMLITFVLFAPFYYMSWQGKALKELIDTTNTDRMARFFYLTGAAIALTAYFIQAPLSPWSKPNPARWKCVEVPTIGPNE